ncbi:glycosyltransferase family 2 protein [soil metagenome]
MYRPVHDLAPGGDDRVSSDQDSSDQDISKRRQWGSDSRRRPLPPVATPATDISIALGRLAIAFTAVIWLGYLATAVFQRLVNRSFRGHAGFLSQTAGYVAITSLLALSCFLYLVARQGALYRTRAHRRTPRAVIDDSVDAAHPTMTVLIPSYREEVHVVRMTMLSAALQEYPALRVVLLLDDPPHPQSPEHATSLAAARSLSAELTDWLAEPRERFGALLDSFDRAESEGSAHGPADLDQLVDEFQWAVDWLRMRAAEEVVTDHVDRFFVEQVLQTLADDFAEVSQALRGARAEGADISHRRRKQLHQRLAWTFRAELTWFERRTYASLSHEANKAMNLNSYIGLMGHRVEVRRIPEGQILVPSSAPGSIAIPDADFLLTLDADSIILPEYCLRLVHVMTRPENVRLAVVQTPYSAFPGSSTRLERLAGATTDIQHIVHQGMSYHGATFWVGANAVIRKRALDDIVQVESEGGFEIRRYVMDRTVIEDTESSLDLVTQGWRLLNYPERLSYSATPPDFGSLAIQRRRWANGGLLILPKLGQVRRAQALRGEIGSSLRTLLRLNYLASTCWSSCALLFLLYFPFDSSLLSPLVLLLAAPYFLSMSTDLRRCGYKRLDIVRIYGLNLILLPVNLAGVLKSVQQGITGRRIPFARTPKVLNRTATPLLFAASPFLIIGYSILTAWRDVDQRYWVNAAFAVFNAATGTYALIALMGVRHALVDIWLGLVELVHVPAQPALPVPRRGKARAAPAPDPASWNEVLYRGAAANATGERTSDTPGQFRILAQNDHLAVPTAVEPTQQEALPL